LLGKLCRVIQFAIGSIANDLIQRGKMIAHVAKHVLLHRLR
jgi:hypothetical protein